MRSQGRDQRRSRLFRRLLARQGARARCRSKAERELGASRRLFHRTAWSMPSKRRAPSCRNLPMGCLLFSKCFTATFAQPSTVIHLPRASTRCCSSYPGIKAIIHHRLAHALYKLDVPIIARIIAESFSFSDRHRYPSRRRDRRQLLHRSWNGELSSARRPSSASACASTRPVTLGAKRFSIDESGALVKGLPRHPIVEDDVVIYAGATILGRVTIGRGSVDRRQRLAYAQRSSWQQHRAGAGAQRHLRRRSRNLIAR